jgi:acetyl/propionyl-CoA carboxylase alpha subunit
VPSVPSWLEALAAASLAALPREPLPALWDGWTSTAIVESTVPIEVGSTARTWRLSGERSALTVAREDGAEHRIVCLRRRGESGSLAIAAEIDGRDIDAIADLHGDAVHLQADGAELRAFDLRLRGTARGPAATSGLLVAPLHGRVTQACAEPGATVAAGALLVVIEAMKMEHQIRAPHDGTIVSLHVRVGDQVAARQALVEVKA